MQNQSTSSHVTLELAVRNHPGVMSHVCGLFARRAYNVEGILCMPLAGGKEPHLASGAGRQPTTADDQSGRKAGGCATGAPPRCRHAHF